MLHRLCNYLSHKFNSWGYIEAEQLEIFRFGLEIIISQGTVFVFLLILSNYLNIFHFGLIFTLVFGYLRSTINGYHATSFIGCLTFTTGIFLLCSIHQILSLSIQTMIFLFLFIVILNVLIILRYKILKFNYKKYFLLILLGVLILFYKNNLDIALLINNAIFSWICISFKNIVSINETKVGQ
ncbi:hypothetical protein A5821_001698 [Enterococcus sp. 7F3_DIV0205]|uniref:Accessory gene regulator B n=1 Tax=Candidatus Enterococcus palustris TaxID=1834189 RepID=A0AAQ3W8C3_9ENTE